MEALGPKTEQTEPVYMHSSDAVYLYPSSSCAETLTCYQDRFDTFSDLIH